MRSQKPRPRKDELERQLAQALAERDAALTVLALVLDARLDRLLLACDGDVEQAGAVLRMIQPRGRGSTA